MVCHRISPSLSRMKSKWCYPASCLLLLSSFLLGGAEACWGRSAPPFGNMTDDYDIEVGSDLVLNCTIYNTTLKGLNSTVNSSDLTIENGDHDYIENIRILDDYSIQMRIRNASESDTGIYFCKIRKKHVVCSSQVRVGYPPLPIKNFSCISRNYENLNCSWEITNNYVNTTYSITKTLFNQRGLQQTCPNENGRMNWCEWNKNSIPQYSSLFREEHLTVRGNNSLGQSEQHFKIDGFAIVIPNRPDQLNVTKVANTSITIEWSAPRMKFGVTDFPFPLKYEIWVKIVYNASNLVVYDVGDVTSNRSSYTIESLIPNILYNISIRCRSSYAEREDMWSTFTSVTVKTQPDVPYESPEVIPEAYELHSFKEYRSVTLFWKAVPQIHHNAENFYYHIQYTQDPYSEPSKFRSTNSTNPFIEIGKLLKNSSYYFYIHSANDKGISQDSELIYIASEDEISPPPEDVTVIRQSPGHYNLSWNPPNDAVNFTYLVLWCSSRKYWDSLNHCNGSIEWIDKNITETNFALHLNDSKTSFQFAVVSRSGRESSGMQWAACIVPDNGGLNKIQSVHVDQINSTTLKVFWYLDCPGEEKLFKKYEITYCAIQGNNKCKVVEVKPNEKSYFLTHLHPFSTYSIKIRSIRENKASEDSDAVYQSTLPGAPSGPPRNVQVHLQGKDTLAVSWLPPAEPNGIITKYVISYNGTSIDVEANRRESVFPDRELKPYSIYAVQIQACVNEHCSEKSEPSMIQTDVDVPGVMKPPIIEGVNETHVKVSWFAPSYPNGPLDYYVIQWHQESQNATTKLDMKLEVSNRNSLILDVQCPSLGDEDVKYLFYVRSVNIRNESNLMGELSKPTQAKACRRPAGVGMLVGLIVGVAIGAALVLVVIYKFALWMRLKIHQVKSITIRLPEGLEGPETNPLNNYECFKNGLNGNLQTSNSERLSYVIDENKNRHGSGSSQFSNSSAEELIFKTGKCTKFGRKPSGDSSGCSSMSSSITQRVHLSSDSGTESDFPIPPSPDSAIHEPSLLNSHKNPLPILMEVHDSLAAEKSLQCSQSPEKHAPQNKQPNGDVILKIDPPYSKFGISGNSSSSTAWRVNPLAFYSCNLANSEPSVFDAQSSKMSEVVLPPYSKVGLAKSSGDIGMSAIKQKGYSKFGLPTPQKKFSIPPSNVNPITMVMLENPDRKELPLIKAILDNNCTQSKKAKMGNISLSSNDLDDDCGYIKVGRSNVCSSKPTNGYVPFNDLRSQMNQCPTPVSINANDQIKNALQDPSADKDQVEFPDVSGWPLFSAGEESRNEDAPEVQFNLPFLSHTSDSPSMEGGLYNTDNYGFSITYPENSMELLSTLPSESDIKYNSDSPTLSYNESCLENNSFLQEDENSVSNGEVLYLSGSTTLEESSSGQIPNNKTKTYAVPNEVIVTPMTLRNGYVPFNALSDTVCGRSSNQLPNASDRRGSKTFFPNGTCAKVDDYFTHNKDDTRLLREGSLPKTVVSPSQKDSLKHSENYIKNGNGYANLSLKYILKPLPKMESEVCEV